MRGSDGSGAEQLRQAGASCGGGVVGEVMPPRGMGDHGEGWGVHSSCGEWAVVLVVFDSRGVLFIRWADRGDGGRAEVRCR